MKIDLQIHSSHSDGIESPEEIINLAKQGSLNIISITDHDTVTAVEITVLEGKKNKIVVIPGIEITTSYRGQPIHVLGYCIDIENQELLNFLNYINDFRQKHFISMIPIININLAKNGLSKVDLYKYENLASRYYSIPGLVQFLYEQNIVKERVQGFQYLEGLEDACPNIEPKEAFAIIHKARGKAFLSHPFAPLISLKNITEEKDEQEMIVAGFKQDGLDGLECYGTGHSPEDTEFALSLVEKHGLLISAGSDWHGCLEKTGETIKKWLPFYLQKLGDLEVPSERLNQILNGLNIYLN